MSYKLTEIANTNGVFKSFFEGAPAINNSGKVTWNALLDDGGSGIYTGRPLSTIATTGADFSGFGYPSINDRGQTSFSAVKGGKSGIYLSSKHPYSPTMVATEGQVLTDVKRTEKFTSFLPDTAINNRGQVAFLAGLTDNNSGLFVGNDKGKINRIADTVGKFGNLEFADLLGTPFEGDVAPSINEKGDTVFWGSLDRQLPTEAAEYTQINPAFMAGNVRGIYLKSANSEIKTVVDNTGKYLSFSGSPDINNSGDVAYIFRGDDLNNVNTPLRGINVYKNGKTKTVVDNNDSQGKDGCKDVDKFFRFGFVDINNDNKIAFSAQFDPLGDVGNDGQPDDPLLGVFTAHQTSSGGVKIDKVVGVGDTVNLGIGKKTVTDLFFFNNEGFNDQGQLAFSLAFDDGTQGIYRADQFTHW